MNYNKLILDLRNNYEQRAEIDELTRVVLPSLEQHQRLTQLGVNFAALAPDQKDYTFDAFVFGVGLREPWFNPNTRVQVIRKGP